MADQLNSRVAVLRATDGAWVRALMGPPGTLERPCCVTVVPSTGEVLCSDVGFHQVVRFRSIGDDTVVGTLGTGVGGGATELSYPLGMVVLEDFVFPLVLFFFFFSCCCGFYCLLIICF